MPSYSMTPGDVLGVKTDAGGATTVTAVCNSGPSLGTYTWMGMQTAFIAAAIDASVNLHVPGHIVTISYDASSNVTNIVDAVTA